MRHRPACTCQNNLFLRSYLGSLTPPSPTPLPLGRTLTPPPPRQVLEQHGGTCRLFSDPRRRSILTTSSAASPLSVGELHGPGGRGRSTAPSAFVRGCHFIVTLPLVLPPTTPTAGGGHRWGRRDTNAFSRVLPVGNPADTAAGEAGGAGGTAHVAEVGRGTPGGEAGSPLALPTAGGGAEATRSGTKDALGPELAGLSVAPFRHLPPIVRDAPPVPLTAPACVSTPAYTPDVPAASTLVPALALVPPDRKKTLLVVDDSELTRKVCGELSPQAPGSLPTLTPTPPHGALSHPGLVPRQTLFPPPNASP